MVSLEYDVNTKDIFSIPDIFYTKDKIEAYKFTGPAQCNLCQNFYHPSQHCDHSLKCIKYGEDHITKDFKKSKDEKATCCNCENEHTANCRGCPIYKKLIQ